MKTNNVSNDNEVDHYEIRLKGHLTDRWISLFGDVSITLEENGIALLTFPVVDQAALHSILRKIRDLNLQLISVNEVKLDPKNETLDNSEGGADTD